MKKLTAILLAMLLCMSMVACGGGNADAPADDSKEPVLAKVIDIDLTSELYAFGVDKDQPELLEKTNNTFTFKSLVTKIQLTAYFE